MWLMAIVLVNIENISIVTENSIGQCWIWGIMVSGGDAYALAVRDQIANRT